MTEIPTHCLRIYFKKGTKAKNLSRLQKLWNNSFHSQIMKIAKSKNLCHVNHFSSSGGYLNHGKIIIDNQEVQSNDLTQCLEIIDSKHKVLNFVNDNKYFLKDCHLITFEVQRIQI